MVKAVEKMAASALQSDRRRPGAENNLRVTAVVNPRNIFAERKRRNAYEVAVTLPLLRSVSRETC